MNKQLQVNDIKDLIEPATRYLFLYEQGATHAFRIRGIHSDFIIAFHPEHFLPWKQREGYFQAAGGLGMVVFRSDGNLVEGTADTHHLPLYKIRLDTDRLSLINRRQFTRYTLVKPRPIFFHCDGRMLEANIINLSEGGMRLECQEALPKNVTLHFEINLPATKGGDLFKTDGVVVYSEPEDSHHHFMTGISFVMPKYLSGDEKKKYLKSLQDFKKSVRSGL